MESYVCPAPRKYKNKLLLYISGQLRNRKREIIYEIDFKFFLHHRGLLKNYNKNKENHFKFDGLTFSSSPKKKQNECDTDQLNAVKFNCAVACSMASARARRTWCWCRTSDLLSSVPDSHQCGGVNGRRYRSRWLVKCLRVWFSIHIRFANTNGSPMNGCNWRRINESTATYSRLISSWGKTICTQSVMMIPYLSMYEVLWKA